MDIHFQATGFLLDMSYSAYYLQVANDFQDSFPGLQTLNLNMAERLPPSSAPGHTFSFTDENKTCSVVIHFDRYFDRKGTKFVPPPSPADVLSSLRHVLKQASDKYQTLIAE